MQERWCSYSSTCWSKRFNAHRHGVKMISYTSANLWSLTANEVMQWSQHKYMHANLNYCLQRSVIVENISNICMCETPYVGQQMVKLFKLPWYFHFSQFKTKHLQQGLNLFSDPAPVEVLCFSVNVLHCHPKGKVPFWAWCFFGSPIIKTGCFVSHIESKYV